MHFLCLGCGKRNLIELNKRDSDTYYRHLSNERKHSVIGEVNVSSDTPIKVFEKDEK